MAGQMSDIVTFRWHEPVDGIFTTFTANNVEEFCQAAMDAAITFRIDSRRVVDDMFNYRAAQLELNLKIKGIGQDVWYWPRVKVDQAAMRLPSRGDFITDDMASDADIVRDSTESWWRAIKTEMINIKRLAARRKNQVNGR